MMRNIFYFNITDKPLEADSLVKKVLTSDIGGIVIFTGIVRNISSNKQVESLTYEANIEFAMDIMNKIFSEVKQKWANVNIAIEHRIGKDFPIGTITLIIVTASPHRNEAYEANRYILERIKDDLPIWKKEKFKNGENKWVGWDN